MRRLKKANMMVIVFFFLLWLSGLSSAEVTSTETPASAQMGEVTLTETSAPAQTAGVKLIETPASAQMRDPFKSPLILEPKAVSQVPVTPLLKYSLSEYKLVGIIWGSLGRVAVVEAPDSKCYVIKPGEEIGKQQGTVDEITQDSLLVKNLVTDYAGRTQEQKITIKLYKEQKEN